MTRRDALRMIRAAADAPLMLASSDGECLWFGGGEFSIRATIHESANGTRYETYDIESFGEEISIEITGGRAEAPVSGEGMTARLLSIHEQTSIGRRRSPNAVQVERTRVSQTFASLCIPRESTGSIDFRRPTGLTRRGIDFRLNGSRCDPALSDTLEWLYGEQSSTRCLFRADVEEGHGTGRRFIVGPASDRRHLNPIEDPMHRMRTMIDLTDAVERMGMDARRLENAMEGIAG